MEGHLEPIATTPFGTSSSPVNALPTSRTHPFDSSSDSTPVCGPVVTFARSNGICPAISAPRYHQAQRPRVTFWFGTLHCPLVLGRKGLGFWSVLQFFRLSWSGCRENETLRDGCCGRAKQKMCVNQWFIGEEKVVLADVNFRNKCLCLPNVYACRDYPCVIHPRFK